MCCFPWFFFAILPLWSLFPIFLSSSLEVTHSVFSLEACQNYRSWLINIQVWPEELGGKKAKVELGALPFPASAPGKSQGFCTCPKTQPMSASPELLMISVLITESSSEIQNLPVSSGAYFRLSLKRKPTNLLIYCLVQSWAKPYWDSTSLKMYVLQLSKHL